MNDTEYTAANNDAADTPAIPGHNCDGCVNYTLCHPESRKENYGPSLDGPQEEKKMTVVMLADGFEEIEALTPVDVLRRAGLTVRTAGVGGRVITGSHGISVACDMTEDEVRAEEVDLLLLPGGMPGSKNLDASPIVDRLIREVNAHGGHLAAICAAPFILGRRGLLSGKAATCYPGFEGELKGAHLSSLPVVTDGNITTAKGMGVALDFALELVRVLLSDDAAKKIADSVQKQ